MPALADLLNATDLNKFATADQTFFLQAAGQLIRDFCGWHIAPSVPVTLQKILCGSRGLIMLPTLYVTSVQTLVIDTRTLVHPDEYEWEDNGTIYRRVPNWPHDPWAQVSYTHGYDETPIEVAAIGYELAMQAMSRPGSNAKDLGAGPYRVTLMKLGVGLDDDQKSRLWSAGVVRPGVA